MYNNFSKLQKTYQSKTAPFGYLLDSIMPKFELNQIIKDDRGKLWQVKSIGYFKGYTDVDDYRKTEISGEWFPTTRATYQTAKVVEYYDPKSFAYQIYRKQYRQVHIRVS